MRVLVVAELEERGIFLAGFVAAAGYEAIPIASVRLLSAVAGLQPDVVVVDGVEDPERARRDIARARVGVAADAPVLLVVPAGSTWLRTLPGDMASVLAVVESGLGARLDALDGEAIGRTVSEVGRNDDQPVRMTWHPETREVAGPEGKVALTASEAVLVDLLLRRPGLVVPSTSVSGALWGDAILDGHGRAAIRTHVYTLRRKLRAIGLGDALVSAPGWGYRIEMDSNQLTTARSRGG